MGKETGISWCHHTCNPWTGCTKVSEGCKFCYAERDTRRWGLDLFGPKKERQQRVEPYWLQVPKWNREAIEAGERRRVFLMSFGDFWEDRPDLMVPRVRMLHLVEQNTALDFLILSKRVADAPRLLKAAGFSHWMQNRWPSNAWAMTSAENDARLNERMPALLDLPADVRGVSCEPLLGALPSLGMWMVTGMLHWVIAGGESGGQARPMHPVWARGVRDAALRNHVAFWWKQWGKWVPADDGPKAGYMLVTDDGHGQHMRPTAYTEGELDGEVIQQLPNTRLRSVHWKPGVQV